MVYIHIFNPSGIHFVDGLRFRSNFIFTQMDGQLCQHRLLTNTTFSHWLEPTLLSYIKFLYTLEPIPGFPSLSYWLFYLLLYQSHIDLISVVLYCYGNSQLKFSFTGLHFHNAFWFILTIIRYSSNLFCGHVYLVCCV